MIDPTRDDIGRRVVYRAKRSHQSDAQPEEGVITSFNEHYVFVRYGAAVTSAATNRADLEWLAQPNNPEQPG